MLKRSLQLYLFIFGVTLNSSESGFPFFLCLLFFLFFYYFPYFPVQSSFHNQKIREVFVLCPAYVYISLVYFIIPPTTKKRVAHLALFSLNIILSNYLSLLMCFSLLAASALFLFLANKYKVQRGIHDVYFLTREAASGLWTAQLLTVRCPRYNPEDSTGSGRSTRWGWRLCIDITVNLPRKDYTRRGSLS